MESKLEVEFDEAIKLASTLIKEASRVIRGKEQFLRYLVTAFFAGGHVLIEDLPGTGKTTVVKTLSHLVGDLDFKRIQFTPDLLPYDISGVEVWDAPSSQFILKKGPLFGNLILADEINRTTPKVQSALLEAMAEKQLTIGNTTYPLGGVFFVAATENPIEFEGTYPLPEAQKDRFLMRLSMGYPDEESEFEIVKGNPGEKELERLEPVCSSREVEEVISLVDEVFCDDRLIHCAVAIAERSRSHGDIEMGVSPRATLMLIRACRAYALISGRDYVIDQDLLDLTPLVFSHRVRMKGDELVVDKLMREVALVEIQKIKH